MLVGDDIGPIIATTGELLARYLGEALALRAGATHGGVLLFEGDDYIGRPVNLAARFCQAAQPNELLARRVSRSCPARGGWRSSGRATFACLDSVASEMSSAWVSQPMSSYRARRRHTDRGARPAAAMVKSALWFARVWVS